MNGLERDTRFDEIPDFGVDFELQGFDINTAFQEAIASVAGDEKLALDEKVRRMEVIVGEGTSDVYRDFIDFRQMAAQMEMTCSHDHAFNQSMYGSETLSGFMDSHGSGDGYDHDRNDDRYEIDPKTGKKTKKKKRRGSWFGVMY